MVRNPTWTRDELILALDLYFRLGRKQADPEHPEIIKLSKILNALPIHPPELRNTEFRNPQGVSMKLGNFLSLDPAYDGKGLQRGSKLDLEVWQAFSNQVYDLNSTASAIVKNSYLVKEPDECKIYNITEEFQEGKLLTYLHKHRERNSKIVEYKKEITLKNKGCLACEVCEFDFKRVYGAIGHGVIECHHIIPLSQLKESHQVTISELALICPNCHRIIHRSRPMFRIEELREVVYYQRKV